LSAATKYVRLISYAKVPFEDYEMPNIRG